MPPVPTVTRHKFPPNPLQQTYGFPGQPSGPNLSVVTLWRGKGGTLGTGSQAWAPFPPAVRKASARGCVSTLGRGYKSRACREGPESSLPESCGRP